MVEVVSTIAVIFDFDDTFAPDSTTALLKKRGINAEKFWGEYAKDLVLDGYDPALAYLKLLLDNIGPGKPLGELTNKDLRAFGASLAPTLYPGLPGLFNDLRKIVKQHKNINIEFYIISGGLQEIIEGIPAITKNISSVYGCRLGGDTLDGPLKYVKRCVTFTEKTRYLFEINKGLDPAKTRANPYLVNEDVAPPHRRIPFKHMVYVGDGLTDIPCFSLVKKGGGTPIGVFDPRQEDSAKRALLKFLAPARVLSIHAPKYRKTDELGSLIRAAVSTKCGDIQVARGEAEGPSGGR